MTFTGRNTMPAYVRNDAVAPQMMTPPPPYPNMGPAVACGQQPQQQYKQVHNPYEAQQQQQQQQVVQQQQQAQAQIPAPSSQRRGNQPLTIFGGRFSLLDRLGSGGFGDVYRAEERDQPGSIAVKVEQVTDANARPEQSFLFHEAKVLQEVHKSIQAHAATAATTQQREEQEKVGIARLKYYGQDGMSRVLIMSLHGHSVENVHRQQGRLSLFATVMIADQILSSLEHVHRAGYVHADLKPDNILFGREDPEQLYLVDFGLSVRFRDRKGKHRPLITNHSFVGTPRYASLRTHMGYTLSRRDDIEQLVYVMIYLFRGRLPWSGLRIDDPDAKEKRIGQMKAETPLDVICAGCPEAFRDVLNYARCMEFEEEPQYQFLHVLLCSLRDSYTLETSCEPSRESGSASGGTKPQVVVVPTAQRGGADQVQVCHAGPLAQHQPQMVVMKGQHANEAAMIAAAAAEAALARNINIVAGVADLANGAGEKAPIAMLSSPGTAGSPAFFSDAIAQGILSGNGTVGGPLSPRIDCLNDLPVSPPTLELQLPGGAPQIGRAH